MKLNLRSLAFVALALVCLSGCGESIRTEYGVRRGDGESSINGTAVLADMFAAAGHSVSSTTYLSPRVAARADCLVWFPDDFSPPDAEHRDWFENWLKAGPPRRLIYVGRDYDAEPDYWSAVRPTATGGQLVELDTRLAEARKRVDAERLRMPDGEDASWFITRSLSAPRKVTTLAGAADWTEDLDATKLNMRLTGRLDVSPERKRRTRVLLSSAGDPLVTRQTFGNGQLYVVTNGSALLNLPLVNHEHRKLAGKLIEACGTDQRVVFVESRAGGPRIYNKDPETHQRSGLQIFTIEPFDLILWHLCVVGLIFCLSRYPIFGRPRPAPAVDTSDFQLHIAALGKYLSRARDPAAARARLDHYLQARDQPGAARRRR